MDLVGPLINVDSFRGSSFGNRTGKSTYDEKNKSMILSFQILNLYKYDKVGKTDTLQMSPRPAATTQCWVATLVYPVSYT